MVKLGLISSLAFLSYHHVYISVDVGKGETSAYRNICL